MLAAAASYLEARVRNGRWLVRIEDIDRPREQPGATKQILLGLERYGFEWDGPVSYQSDSLLNHEEAIQLLVKAGQAYCCGCSRRDLAEAPRGQLGIIYPGTCRDGCTAEETSVRVRTDNQVLRFDDGLQGPQSHRLESESGDFVIRRRDGLMAYQLAVVVDDYLQSVTEVVRGIDLIDSTARQIWLQRLLRYPEPAYQHIPVAVNANGQKLSKSFGAGGISMRRAPETLVAALDVLGQQPPTGLSAATTADIWSWARENWTIGVLQAKTAIPVSHIALSRAEQVPT